MIKTTAINTGSYRGIVQKDGKDMVLGLILLLVKTLDESFQTL